MSDNNQQPKCLRIVVTAFFADGSSTVIDIPEPSEVKDESHVIGLDGGIDDYSPYAYTSSQYEFVLKVKINPDIPMRRTPLPIPK